MSKSKDLISLASKPQVIVVIGAVSCAILLIDYYIKLWGISYIATQLSNWGIVIEYFGLAIGLPTMLQRNVIDIRRRKGEWYLAAITSAVAITMTVFNLVGGTGDPVYRLLNVNVRGIGQSAMFALQGFFFASAALRAFKMRTFVQISSILIMMLMLLYNVPLGGVIWPGIPIIGKWMETVGYTAGSRAIFMCGAVGAILLGIRMLLGFERQAFGIMEREKRTGGK